MFRCAAFFSLPLRRLSGGAGMVVAMLAALHSPSRADGLTFDASAAEKGTYSTNPLLSISDTKPLWGSTTSPELVVKDTAATSQMSFDTRVDQNEFNQSQYDSTDFHEDANLAKQNQNWQVSSEFKTDYDTTRSSELSDFNGLNAIIARHMGLMAAPQVTYTPNSMDALSLTGNVERSIYDNSFFTNYATYSATPSYAHHFDPMNTGIVSLQAQRYQTTQGPSIRIDTIAPSLGWQTTLSQRLYATANVGAQTVRQYNGGIAASPWTWQYTFSAGLAFKGQQDTINLAAARAQFPYANGTEALQTSFNATESHALNSMVSLNIGGSYLTASYPVTTTGSIETLASGTGGVTYHVTEDVDLSATYQYRRETLTLMPIEIHDNSGILGLVIHPKEWTFTP